MSVRTEQILRFLSVGDSFRPFIERDGELTLGDHFVFHDFLHDMTDRVVGRDAGLCTLVAGRTYLLNVTMELPDGCVTAQGFVEDRLGLLAVTGGTDRYRDVCGDVRISRSCEDGLDVTLRLTGIRQP
jgi:hypothetical protein